MRLESLLFFQIFPVTRTVLNLMLLKRVLKPIDKHIEKSYNNSIKSNER